MILIAVVLAQLAAPTTAVNYRGLPPEVVSASVYRWSDARAPERATTMLMRPDGTLSIAEPPGMRSIVVFVRSDGRYLIDGPFVWPDRDSDRRPDPVWRRTVAGARWAAFRSTQVIDWVSSRISTWPECRWAESDRFECWGTPDDSAGVVVALDGGRVWWCTVQRAVISEWHNSKWARLVTIDGPDGGPAADLKVEVRRAIAPPAYRLQAIRLDSGPVPSITVTPLSPEAVWVAGAQPPEKSWLSVRARDAAPAFVSLADVAGGAATAPERLTLDAARRIEGRVVGGTQPAAQATVTVFRLIDPPRASDRESKPRRVFEAETTADDSGGFAFDAIGNGDHELVAWHPQFGQASLVLETGQSTATIRLRSPGVARGRVLVAGRPAAGIDVFSVPDAKAFAAADDPVDVKGGDGRTSSDGRFVVSLAPSGGGELRIGGGNFATKRLRLPGTPLPVVDLGDIELTAPLTVSVVLDRESPCDLVATGPIGRLGLQIVAAVRTGPGLFRITLAEEGQWEFGLDCAGTIRPLVPAFVSVTSAMSGKELRLRVR